MYIENLIDISWETEQLQARETYQLRVYDGMSLQLSSSPLWKRVLAFAVDIAIIQLVLGVVVMGSLVVFGLTFGSLFIIFQTGMKEILAFKPGIILLVLFALVFLLIMFSIFDGFFIYFEWKKGATPGKRLLGLKVISLGSGRLTLGQCALRDIMRWVDVGLLLPGLISIILTEKKQRLGDLLAGTVVSHSVQEEEEQKYFYVTQDFYQWFMAKCSPTAPTVTECENFLKFAYPAFALQTRTLSSMEIKKWEEYANTHVSGLKELAIDQDAKLRLFAELCFQTKNATTNNYSAIRRSK
ncbi:MAG: RDD family protein [Proteobacteria bacterium]|nr:RDD family protein [Pseudomonadota bacterium]